MDHFPNSNETPLSRQELPTQQARELSGRPETLEEELLHRSHHRDRDRDHQKSSHKHKHRKTRHSSRKDGSGEHSEVGADKDLSHDSERRHKHRRKEHKKKHHKSRKHGSSSNSISKSPSNRNGLQKEILSRFAAETKPSESLLSIKQKNFE